MTHSIGECRLPDDLDELTRLLHRAYASSAANGMKFLASHQSAETTERRIKRGRCFVATIGNRLVGTITVRGADSNSTVPVYREPETFSFGQFGVDPEFRGRGIGRSLHDHIIRHATSQGAMAMALDTAAPAADLICMYERWGYRIVARHRWDVVNYESVIMRKELKQSAAGGFA